MLTPSLPVSFLPAFIAQLENSPATDASRASDAQAYVHKQVGKELQARVQAAEAAVKAAVVEAGDKSTGGVSRVGVDEKVKTLKATLERVSAEVLEGKEVVAARKAVVACIKANQGRVLECWDQVAAFKTAVNWQ